MNIVCDINCKYRSSNGFCTKDIVHIDNRCICNEMYKSTEKIERKPQIGETLILTEET